MSNPKNSSAPPKPKANEQPKLMLVKLTPSMSREQKAQNLITALEKTGFTIKPAKTD